MLCVLDYSVLCTGLFLCHCLIRYICMVIFDPLQFFIIMY
jgi:hypothetical protein